MEKLCSFAGCGKTVKGKGLCTGHIKQLQKGQELRALRPKIASYGSAEAYYDAKVLKRAEGCWGWQGERHPRGYGQLTRKYGRVLAHRYSYTRWVGEIGEGLVIDHLCHNPECSRPDHLRAVTQKQNMENRKGAQSDSTTGIRGVHTTRSGKYRARIKSDGVEHRLGVFDTVEEAEKAYLKAKREMFGL